MRKEWLGIFSGQFCRRASSALNIAPIARRFGLLASKRRSRRVPGARWPLRVHHAAPSTTTGTDETGDGDGDGDGPHLRPAQRCRERLCDRRQRDPASWRSATAPPRRSGPRVDEAARATVHTPRPSATESLHVHHRTHLHSFARGGRRPAPERAASSWPERRAARRWRRFWHRTLRPRQGRGLHGPQVGRLRISSSSRGTPPSPRLVTVASFRRRIGTFAGPAWQASAGVAASGRVRP